MTGRGHAACISGLAFSASTIVLGAKTRLLPLVVIESLDASSKAQCSGLAAAPRRILRANQAATLQNECMRDDAVK